MLLKADLLLQLTILCKQLLWSCADLFQADRDLAAASYCWSGKFSYKKPIISSITAWPLLLEFDTYDSKINATCKIRPFIALIRKLWTVWETLILRLILNDQDIMKYHYFLDDFPLLRRVVFNISPCKLTTESLFAPWLVQNVILKIVKWWELTATKSLRQLRSFLILRIQYYHHYYRAENRTRK